MNADRKVFACLRRRRSSAGRLVLALFAMASVTAGAAPCFAMGHPLDVGAHHHAASEPAAGVAHQHHAHASSPAPQSSTGDAAHVAHAAKHCPHCPGLASTPAHSETGSHVLCSAHDGASDSMPTFAKLLLPKHDSSCMSADLPPPPLLRPPSGPALAHTVPRAYSPVALHVRHCVFLI